MRSNRSTRWASAGLVAFLLAGALTFSWMFWTAARPVETLLRVAQGDIEGVSRIAIPLSLVFLMAWAGALLVGVAALVLWRRDGGSKPTPPPATPLHKGPTTFTTVVHATVERRTSTDVTPSPAHG